MDTIFSSVNQTGILTYLRIYMIPVLLILAATALVCVSRWRIFKKLGLPGWKGIIPIYGDYKLFKSRWRTMPFWVLVISNIMYYAGMFLTSFLMAESLSANTNFTGIEEITSFFIPYIAAYGLLSVACLIVTLAITVNLNYQLAKSFGDGIGYALGLTILPVVFYPLLAFVKKQKTRMKRPLQFVSATLTLALVFSVVASAPFSISAAEADSPAAASADAPFGELNSGRYTLESQTYKLEADFTEEGYIYVPSGVEAVIDLNSYTIDRDTTVYAENGYVIRNSGTLTITDSSGNDSGKITGGYAYQGGAVNNSGTLTINGGSFVNNRASREAGVVMNNSGAVLTVNGGVFTNNIAEAISGGAFVNSGTMTVTGGTVTNNIAKTYGGGIFNSDSGTLNMSGSPIIKDNANGNLWLSGNTVINVTGLFANDAEIDVHADNMTADRAITNGFINTDSSMFTFASGAVNARIRLSGEVYSYTRETVTVNTWAELKDAVGTDNAVIALGQDITNPTQNTSDPIKITNKTVTIDLMGHTLDRNCTSEQSDGHVIWASDNSNVTIRDTVGGGVIKGGYATNGGGINIAKSAVLNLYNVTVAENTAVDGGGIFVRGTLSIDGAVIKDNSSTDDGGAIHISDEASAVSIKNAVITGNYGNGSDKDSQAGAIYQNKNITTDIVNTFITENESNAKGGGIYLRTGKINMTGGAVEDNSSTAGGGVFVTENTTFTADGTLFSDNEATNGTGGAICDEGYLTLTDCTVTDNSAKTWGGGVYLADDTNASLSLNGGRIENNACVNNGGGVHVSGTAAISVSGAPVVKNNVRNNNIVNNVRLTGNTVFVASNLTDGAQIGVTAASYDRVLATGLTSEADMAYFILDETNETSELTKTFDNGKMYVKKINKVSVSSWTELQNAINSAQYETVFTLTQTLNADGASAMRIPDGKKVIIDLKGFDLNRGLTKEGDAGHVIQMKGASTLTIRDTGANQAGKITGGWSEHGGGINVEGDGALYIESGNISGNHAKYGGGVYVADDAVCVMSGGSVTGNVASQDGGGIFADYPVTVTGGVISGNSAKYGGGYYFDEPDKTAELSGVTISDNTASEKGGGIYVWHGTVSVKENSKVNSNSAKLGGAAYVTDKCTLTAENTTFNKNKSTDNGGAIKNDETLTLTSCTFEENESGKNGGAVYNSDKATITDCTFKKNKATNGAGGAIKQYDGEMALIGGTITDNMASSRGSGVFVDEESDDKKFSIQGNIQITGNTGSDVYLDGEEVIVIADTLANTAKVGVSMKTISGTFTKGFAAKHPGEDPALYFTADAGYAVIPDNAGEAMVIESEWELLRKMFLKDENTFTVKLDRDWDAIKGDKTIEIPAGKNITLDLNGHTIDAKKAISQSIIDVKGKLTIKDSSENHDGKITGGNCGSGGALYIFYSGTVNLQSGIITGNTAEDNGGAIYNGGTLNISGGVIKDNSAKLGGAVYNYGTMTVTGGSITGNTASENGGGIWSNMALNLEGGTISGNSAIRHAGGIFVSDENSSELNVKNAPVVEKNNAPIGNNILLCGSKAVTVTGELNSAAKLDVVTKNTAAALTSGYSTHGSPLNAFTYNGSATSLEVNTTDHELHLKEATGDFYVSSWTELQNAINSSSEGNVIVLTADAVCDNGSRLKVNDKTVTIELNGHKIDRSRKSGTGNGQVFGVMGNSHLTISDVAGTGIITGGYSHDGGGIFIEKNATVTINGASIQGNTADNDGGDGGGVYNEGTLIMNGGSIAFNKADDTGGGIYCTDSGTIKLENALITGNYSDDDDGGGMNLHLKDNNSYIKYCTITNNECGENNGGGIRLDAKGKTLTIENTRIEGNTADEKGGGFYITEGTIEITDSFVNNNISEDDGGAAYCEKGTTLTGVSTEFNNNSAVDDGGGIEAHGSMTLTSCKVNKNFTKDSGGGIYYDDDSHTLELTDTEVDSNTSNGGQGGGINVNNGSLSITRGSLSHNRTSGGHGSAIYFDGKKLNIERTDFVDNYNRGAKGTIYLQTGEAHIKGGSFKNNFVKVDGGGVFITKNTKLYVEAATYTENGVEKTESVTFDSNHADQHGGAILLCDDGSLYLRAITATNNYSETGAVHANEDFYISGKINLNKSDKESGLYMEDDDDKVHIDGAFEKGSHINIELEEKTGSFTKGFKEFHEGEPAEKYFSAQEGYAVDLDKNGEVKVKDTDWLTLQQMINNAASGDKITLTKDYEANDADTSLVIPEDKTLTIDLHGYKLNGSGELKGGTVLKVGNNAILTIEDNYELPEGESEENAERYEGVITGGTASAIVNNGTLTIKGGKITGNKGGKGGGINNCGTMTVTGGRIKSNAATEEGGGIHNSGTLYLSGGEIKNNTSAFSGGGVFCDANSKIYVKGKPYVLGNNGAAGKNIVLSSGVKITLNGTVDSAAKLDVAVKDYKSAITSGYAANGRPQGVFSYNENNNITLTEKSGELYFPYTVDADEWVGSWAELQSAVNNEAYQGKTIGLTNDLGKDGQERIEVENGRAVTIELAGHTMNRGFTSKQDQGNVFKVSGSGTHLTVKDTVGTGIIRGGFANGDGGGFYVVSGAKLTIESGAVCGNSASSDGGGIYVDNAELVMTGGAVSGNYSDDNGGGIYTSSSAKIALSGADITVNKADNAGGGMNLHLKENATFTNCNISYNETDDTDGGGIVMNASGKTLTLDSCKVNNNIADDCGGGIYVDAGTVEASGGQINSNKADDGGGVYVSGGDTFKLTNEAVIANNKTTGKSGGGITCHGDLVINDATVALNRSAKYGGGVFYQNSGHKITLTKANIIGNEAENDGGGLYIKQGEVEFSGGEISANTSIDGGGVFVTDNTKFTAKNGAKINENTVTSEDGGGIVNKGETILNGITVSSNTAKNKGGGIWNEHELTVTNCTIDKNKATLGVGGGIAHMDGKVWLKGSNYIRNNKSIYGGGVYVEKEADKFYIEDAPVITDNSGSNVYLYKEVITLNGSLTDGARISVSTYDDTGKFTKDFESKNKNVTPNTFFVSDYAYEVYLDGGEAALKWIVDDDPNAFIDKNNNIIDYNKVGGRNWMSAVSGERKLNEINVIRAHDAAMNNAQANYGSSEVTLGFTIAGYVGTAVFFTAALFSGFFTAGVGWGIAGLVFAGISTAVAAIGAAYKDITRDQAKTQYHYINEMMDMGVRVFDLRINNKNWNERNDTDHDDGKSLWHCHGESKKGGCIYGCDPDGNVLSVEKTLEWGKEFLKKNPTEVLFFEYSPETQDNEKYDSVLATRLKRILKEFSYEINPSTGKPYLYMEDGEFGKDYTYWPKLKDVRGQIVYKYGNVTDDSPRVGGYDWDLNGVSPDYGRKIGDNATINTPYERINQTESAAVEHPSPNILTDAMVHRNFNSGYYVNTTDDPEAAVNWLLHPSKQSYMTKTPLELEEKVLYGDGKWVDVRDTTVWYEFKKAFGTEDWYDIEYEPGYEGLLREGGIVNQTGEYYGVFSFDGVTDKEAKMCWYSNFYEDLEYCTVTVKSGLAGDDTVKTYKVLKGTAITIPNCIYDKPEQSALYFQNWHAVTGSNNNWEPSYSLQDEAYFGTDYTGIDNRAWLVKHTYEEQINPATQIAQNSEKDVMPGDVVTIMDNTEFTAVWGSEVKAPVTVVWNDGDNGDGLRTDRLELTYQINSVSGTKTATVEDSSNWSAMLTGEVLVNTLKVNWSQVNATTEKPKGDPENGYSYEVTGNIDTGFTITMRHVPQKTVTAAGVVMWDDNNDVKQIRPDSVTLHLLKNGEEINSATATSAGGWAYDFGTFPAYTEVGEDGVVTYRRDVYSVIEDPIKCYAVSYNDFDVTNMYVDPDTTDLIVEINWKDSYNSYGERPETVTLHLWDGDIEIDKQTISVDGEEAITLTYFDLEKYEMKHLGESFDYHVTLDSISKYTTEYKDMEENVLSVTNTFDKSGKYFRGHSLSLNGDIGVNFYLDLTEEQISTAKLHFEWFDKELELNGSDLVYNAEQHLYKASVPVAVAEMTYNINAVLYLDGAEVERDRYSVAKYAQVIMSDNDFYNGYIEKMTAELGDNEKAKEKYSELLKLVVTMLDYGAKAQTVFDRNIDHLANEGVSLFGYDVTSDMIDSKSSDMTANTALYGLEYQYSAVVYLSKTSLRHYYKITDETKFNAIKSGVTFDGQNVEPVKRGDLIFFEKQDISASHLDTQYTLKIGNDEYKYSAMDYTKRLIDSDNDKKFIELGKATYRFNQAANTYFGD